MSGKLTWGSKSTELVLRAETRWPTRRPPELIPDRQESGKRGRSLFQSVQSSGALRQKLSRL